MVQSGVLAVIASYILMVLSNVLSMKKVFGGKDNKVISDAHPTYVSPDGKTFAIWGLIYLMETVLVVAQAIPSERADKLLGRKCALLGLDVRWRIVLAFLSNAVWLPIFSYERFWSALAVMLIYLGFLLSVYADVNVGTAETVLDRILFTSGITMNASWIVVATMVNTFLCFGTVGWQDQHGVAGSVLAGSIVVVLVALLGAERGIRACDLTWAFVAAWALQGIYRMQTVPDKVRFPISAMSKTLASCAWWSSLLVVAAMVVGIGLAARARLTH